MSRTLFWYVFRDLLRIFFLASGALAGIMSFGGLLRPLTEHGLSASQVGKMLTYFSPAMTTYSFPVAAVFAATMVYGRLSSDNELTACRATGISYLSMMTPALVLGLVVSMTSLFFLSFIVPIFTLKVEETIYSNLARLIENQIERTHQLRFDTMNVFAESATVLPPDKADPKLQRVELTAPMIVSYTQLDNPNPDLRMRLPAMFSLSNRADLYLREKGDAVEFRATMQHGSRFARDLRHGQQAFDVLHFGPVKFPSPIREDTKFMNIYQLKELYNAPEDSRRLRDEVHDMRSDAMTAEYLGRVAQALNEQGSYRFVGPSGTFIVTRGDMLVMRGPHPNELVLRWHEDSRQARLDETGKDGIVYSSRRAVDLRIRVDPVFSNDKQDDPVDFADPHLVVTVDGYDVLVDTEEDEANHRSLESELSVPMPRAEEQIRQMSIRQFMDAPPSVVPPAKRKMLNENRRKLLSKITGEIHGRAALSVSCLVLVMVGCALGMMFRSGNFLNAFAISFIPAMLTIALVVTGQQICGNNPSEIGLGLGFIWTGDLVVMILSIFLIGKLQQQ